MSERLIDAHALIKSMKSHTVEDNGLTDDYKAGLTDSIRTAVALTENASTIDAVPVVCGEWIPKTGRAMCSVCADECWADSALEYAYCPNCGAKMDGKP